jgi:hypothetical protein
MLKDSCPTCGSRRLLVSDLLGLEKRRFPHGKFVCDFEHHHWHLKLENLQRSFDVTLNGTVRQALQVQIEALILEFCVFDFRPELAEQS